MNDSVSVTLIALIVLHAAVEPTYDEAMELMGN